jgi:hypothetical protein
MKWMYALLTAAVLLAGAGTGHAAVRIADDRGGLIANYLDRYEGLRASGEAVVIDGLCASACTMVLGAVPHDRICVTSNAALGFHAAYNFVGRGRTATNLEATELLYAQYPPQVQRWITSRGGLTPHIMFLRGRQLEAMYRPCGSGVRFATIRGESGHMPSRSPGGLGAAFMRPRAAASAIHRASMVPRPTSMAEAEVARAIRDGH